MGIVVIGDVFIDVKGYSTAPFIPGGRNAGEIQQIHGGVGRNVVEDIANIELKPTFVSLVDDDAMGEEVIRKLDRHKVDTRFMRKVPNGMGTWLFLTRTGMWWHPFPRDRITAPLSRFWRNAETRSSRMRTAW